MRPQDFAPRQPYAVMAAAYDVDAQAIIDDVLLAGGTLSNSDKAAINDFVLGAKAASLWARLIDGTLMVGGTAAAVQVDFVRHGQQCITSYTGPPTFSANGMQGNASTMWALLYQNASAYTSTNLAIDVFNASNNIAGVNEYDYGAANAIFSELIQIRDVTSANGGNVVSGNGLGTDFVTSAGIVDTRGMHTCSRSGAVLTYYFRGNSVGSNGAIVSSTLPAIVPSLLARNHNATFEGRTANLLQFYCARESFSALETLTWYNLVYQLQVDLGRNTY